MSISPIPSIGSVGATRPIATETEKPATGFAEKVGSALQNASETERTADLLAQDVATGGETSVEELMIATTKATLTTEMLVQVRNKAVEAYQEVMRMQV